MAAYALFAGADFGGGIWDLLAGSPSRGRRARDAIDASVTSVWEGNQVWIVFGLVLLFTGFPSAFAAISVTLFVPLAASVLGIVLRGVGFAFRHEAIHPVSKWLTGVLFGCSSFLAPFFLGTAVGAVTTGRIPVPSRGLSTAAWTTPTALVGRAWRLDAERQRGFIIPVHREDLAGHALDRGHRTRRLEGVRYRILVCVTAGPLDVTDPADSPSRLEPSDSVPTAGIPRPGEACPRPGRLQVSPARRVAVRRCGRHRRAWLPARFRGAAPRGRVSAAAGAPPAPR
jgi:hypothetical protein